jgi:hypothetical protein
MVPYVSVAQDGTVWARSRSRRGGPDAVVAVASSGSWQRFADLKAAVGGRSSSIIGRPDLRDFWGVDREGRIWIGMDYFDKGVWKAAGTDDLHVGGSVVHEQRVVLDEDGRAWVPFHAATDCAPPRLCINDGVRAFSTRGKDVIDLVAMNAPEAGRFGAPLISLVPSRTGDDAWVAGRRNMYLLPLTVPLEYPGFDNLFNRPEARNAGFASAAISSPGGYLQVFLWIEEHTFDNFGRRMLKHKVTLSDWDGANWTALENLSDAPVFPQGVAFDTIVAADYAADGSMWVGTSGGLLGVRDRLGAWRDVFTPSDSILEPGERIYDVAVDASGNVWLGTDRGLLVWGAVSEPPPLAYIYLPSAEKP